MLLYCSKQEIKGKEKVDIKINKKETKHNRTARFQNRLLDSTTQFVKLSFVQSASSSCRQAVAIKWNRKGFFGTYYGD